MLRVCGEDFVQDREKAAILGKGPRRRRDGGGGADGEVRIGRRAVKVGEKIRGRVERVGKNFLRWGSCRCVSVKRVGSCV